MNPQEASPMNIAEERRSLSHKLFCRVAAGLQAERGASFSLGDSFFDLPIKLHVHVFGNAHHAKQLRAAVVLSRGYSAKSAKRRDASPRL